MFLTYQVSEGLVFHVCVKLSRWFLHIRDGPAWRQNQSCLLALIKVSKNQWQESEICTEDSADLRTNLLHTSFGGHPSSNPAQTRYLPPRALPGGLYASVSADHETKAVQGLKNNAGNTSNNFSPTNLPPPLVTRLKASLQRGYLWSMSCVDTLTLKLGVQLFSRRAVSSLMVSAGCRTKSAQ